MKSEVLKPDPLTRLPKPGDPDAFFIFDLSCWLYRFWAKVEGAAAHETMRFIGRILDRQKVSLAAVCCDLPNPSFRHDIAPGVYKAHRSEKDPKLLSRLQWARELLEDVIGIRVYARLGYEADDLIGALATGAAAKGLHVVIVGRDKDLLQVVDERTVMWDAKAGVMGPLEVRRKFGVNPDQLRDYLAIVGDQADNIPGIKGAGPKAAVELLTQFGTLEAALDSAAAHRVHDFWKKRPRYRPMIHEAREDARLSARLATLALDALKFEKERVRL